MDENNNFPNMGPDPNLLSGNQPQDPYAGQPQDPYAGQPQDPYAGQPQDPYAGQQQESYSGQSQNPYGQQQESYSGQSQNPYGQQQESYSGQSQNPYGQPQAPQNPYGQPAMQFNDGAQQGAQPGAQMGFTPPPITPEVVKKKKKGLIIGIIIAAVVLIGGGIAAFFLLRGDSDDIKGAEKVCEKFLDAYGDLDAKAMFDCFPEGTIKGTGMDELGTSEKEAETYLNMLKGMFSIDNIKVVSSEELSDSDLSDYIDDYNDENGKSISADKGARVEMSCDIKVSAFGMEETDTSEMTFICAYIKGKWYIIDADEDDDEAEIDDGMDDWDENTTEAQIDDDSDDDLDNDNDDHDSDVPSKLADVPNGLSDNLSDLSFYFDGNIYTIPFDYSEFDTNTWKMSYDLDEDDKVLGSGESAYSIGFSSDKYDQYLSFYITVSNYTNADVDFEKGVVSSFNVAIDYTSGDVPEMIMPKGITWGSNKADIENAYGEPNSTYDSSSLDYETMTYSVNDFDSITFRVSDDKGLCGVDIYHYQ